MRALLVHAAWLCRVAVLLLLLGGTAQADGRALFGLGTVPAKGPLAVTWARLQAQMKLERPLIARCRAAPSTCGSAPALQFIAMVGAANGFAGLARIGRINRAVNFAIRAVQPGLPDAAQDKWTSPLQTLALGVGDYKQYAVLKYAALQTVGFAADDLRIAILARRADSAVHAVAAVRFAGRWLILDNRILTIIDSRELLDRYRPLFTLGPKGLREFVPQPPRTVQARGAACAG